jgi:alanyl-tRNA synthetase
MVFSGDEQGSGMTERLYYRDSYLREFDASVLSCEPDADGARWKVTLDRTAFYPTSGGQPHDLGRLGEAEIVDVADEGEEKVVHYVSAALRPGPVHAQIDWQRRFDHMQQHTAQHLLSSVFIELFKFPTVSFHLGKETSTIDLEAPAIVQDQLDEAERRSNEVIFEDRVVNIRFGMAEDLAAQGVRKKVDREGVLRAIEIEGIDLQPCGGTHLARTGQAGLILLQGMERRRNSWRVEYVAGFRALAAARVNFMVLGKAAELLSCGPADVPASLAKAIEERRQLHSASKRLEERLAELECRVLLAENAPQDAKPRVVAAEFEDAPANYLSILAAKLVAEDGVIALLANRSSGYVVIAQRKNGPKDLGALAKELFKELGGKGGGGRDFAQGTLASALSVPGFLAAAKAKLSV